MTQPTDSKKSKNSVYRYLPIGYQPGQFDVLCGRGRRCYFHGGNEHFRSVVTNMIPNYNGATSKIEKGYILSVIVQKIRALAGIGGFIKKDLKKGQWYEVGDFLAREKVSQAFRDALSDKYKSSNAYKKMRREVEQTGQLFETFLEKSGSSPESSPSSLQKPTCGAVTPTQVVPLNQKESQFQNEASFSDALFGLLDRDLEQHFQKQVVTSRVMDTTDDPFEPCPIAGPNPFERLNPFEQRASGQNAVPYCPNIFPGSNQKIQRRFETDSSDFHSCPDLPAKPSIDLQKGLQGFGMAQLLLLTAAQQNFNFTQV